MLFYRDEEELKEAKEKLKKQIEHDIEWNEAWIKKLEGFTAIDTSEAIKSHQGYIAKEQKMYADLAGNFYGKQKLTVIKGGLYQTATTP